MNIQLQPATLGDAPELAALHTSVAEHLTGLYGIGPWSGRSTEAGVLFGMRTTEVFVAREEKEIIATLRLATKKPWAIDRSYFTEGRKPLYLFAMAVRPDRQRQGIGRSCLEDAQRLVKARSADAIFLDAYDAKAGVGDFYASCGYREVGRATYRNTPLIYYELLLR